MTIQAGIQGREIGDEAVDPTTAIDRVVARYAVTSSPIKSRCYMALGCVFVAFAILGLVLPGWPTVSWAVPAAFLFSLSNERLFRWSLANRFFGPALLRYYEQGKTLPRHAKLGLVGLIALMSLLSAWFVFRVSYPADPGYGPATILLVGLIGIWYVAIKLPTREG
jgi:uncharacterized membrane protein YbaN (DUF454 family)